MPYIDRPIVLVCKFCKERFLEMEIEILKYTPSKQGVGKIEFNCLSCKRDTESLRLRNIFLKRKERRIKKKSRIFSFSSTFQDH